MVVKSGRNPAQAGAPEGDESLWKLATEAPESWRALRQDLISFHGLDHVLQLDRQIYDIECRKRLRTGQPLPGLQLFAADGEPLPLWDDVREKLSVIYGERVADEIHLLARRCRAQGALCKLVIAENDELKAKLAASELAKEALRSF